MNSFIFLSLPTYSYDHFLWGLSKLHLNLNLDNIYIEATIGSRWINVTFSCKVEENFLVQSKVVKIQSNFGLNAYFIFYIQCIFHIHFTTSPSHKGYITDAILSFNKRQIISLHIPHQILISHPKYQKDNICGQNLKKPSNQIYLWTHHNEISKAENVSNRSHLPGLIGSLLSGGV